MENLQIKKSSSSESRVQDPMSFWNIFKLFQWGFFVGKKTHNALLMSKSPDRSACRTIGVPKDPDSAIFLTSKVNGWNRVQTASIKNTLCSLAVARRDRNSEALHVTGFSHKTFFPALRAARALV